ncbi:hypothetical protein H0H93_002114 [Arthromyces matolae]|nr:hypothetical protein H0H93_002114 [Arthromyces matolae]
MAGPSSARSRTKTGEITNFFRGYPPRQSSQGDSVSNSVHLSVPLEDSESTTPKKSKLPFLGRTRKKSTTSVKSGNLPLTGRGYESEVAEPTTTRKDRRLSYPVPPPEPPMAERPSPPSSSAIPHINVSSPSFGSKLVAHFTSSRLRKPASHPTREPTSDGNNTDTLSPPTKQRGASMDSTTTAASTIPPPTPRATAITIPSAPTNLAEYSNVFTLSTAKKATLPRRQSATPASQYRDIYNKTDSRVSPTPSSPSKLRVDPSGCTGLPRPSGRGTPQRTTENVKSLKMPKKRALGLKLTEDSTPEDSTTDESVPVRSTDTPPASDALAPSPSPSIKSASTSTRTRLRAPSALKEGRTSSPPTIPLPEPPTNASSPSGSPVTPSASPKLESPPLSGASTIRRPRANTIGSMPPTPVNPATISTTLSSAKQTLKLSTQNVPPVRQTSTTERSDLDSLTVEQLKEALIQRNQQYAELTSHFLEVTKGHAAEKAALQKRIATLEAEGTRKDKEIQGFTWMLNNRDTLPPPDSDVDYTKIPGPRTQRNPSTKTSRRIQPADDSGAESPSLSGAESVPGSGGSVRLKKGLRPLTLGESTYSMYRSSISSKSSSSRGPAVDNGIPDQRASVYSLSSSSSPTAASSTSSLLPPSPSITVSSLSAIPEISAVVSSKGESPRISTSTKRDSLSASEWETDPGTKSQNGIRTARRVSGSSFTSSSSSAATTAYSANLRRSRPPSIAQVLQKSNTMDDVLEKLRPFARTSATAEA